MPERFRYTVDFMAIKQLELRTQNYANLLQSMSIRRNDIIEYATNTEHQIISSNPQWSNIIIKVCTAGFPLNLKPTIESVSISAVFLRIARLSAVRCTRLVRISRAGFFGT